MLDGTNNPFGADNNEPSCHRSVVVKGKKQDSHFRFEQHLLMFIVDLDCNKEFYFAKV